MMTVPTIDIDALRAEFPILATEVNGRPLAYLDNAATSQKPLCVIETLNRYYRDENANVHRGVHHLSMIATREFDSAREKVRELLNARETKEVIFTKGCTEGINLVASCLARGASAYDSELLVNPTGDVVKDGLQPGDEILLTGMEHHSNIVPWQLAAEQTGAVVRPIAITDAGEVDLDAYRSMLSERVKVVGIVHVSNSLGTINPVKEMVRMAHAVGALVLVDGAQAGPHVRIDVQDLDADFYTLSCHKIYAPTGVGVLYGKCALLEAMPPYQGGGDMIRTVSFERTTYAELPAKYEAGTPNIADVVGLGAAVDYLKDLGERIGGEAQDPLTNAFAWIHAREAELTERATAMLNEIPGLRITGTVPQKSGIVAFTLAEAHPHDIGTILDGEGVAIRAGHHCCMPLMKRLGVPATARASFAFYNTEEEADRLVAAVRKVAAMFA